MEAQRSAHAPRFLHRLSQAIAFRVGEDRLMSLAETDMKRQAFEDRFDRLVSDGRELVLPFAQDASVRHRLGLATAALQEVLLFHPRDTELGAVRLPGQAVAAHLDAVWDAAVGEPHGSLGLMTADGSSGARYGRDLAAASKDTPVIELAGWGGLHISQL